MTQSIEHTMETRLYTFTNMYISGIHVGLQSLHSSHELRNKYSDRGLSATDPKYFLMNQWARKDKTVIALNAGDNQKMAKIRGLLESSKNPYPFGAFRESGLGNQLTSQCIVLPDYMYDNTYENVKSFIYDGIKVTGFHDYTEWETEFLTVKGTCSLAI